MRKRHENGEQPEPPVEGGTSCVVELTPEAAVDQVSETEKLAAQLTEKDKEIAELKDKYLRTLADFENARKRLRQQGEESVRLQRENLLRGILPIVDNLERAVVAAKSSNGKSIVEGVEMVLQSVRDFLKAEGVTPLSAVGQLFDPQRHEAMDQVESAAHPPNTVVSEFHRGYLIGDRMLRPARVTVAKNSAPKADASDGAANDDNEGEGKS
jgi:molecular chaperone GrpE